MEVGNSRKDFIDLEAKLIKQEHRLIPVLINLFVRGRKWSNDDPRKSAAIRALIWKIFGTTITFGAGGLIAYFTIYGIWKQNTLLSKDIDQQNTISKFERKLKSAEILFKSGGIIGNEKVRRAALIEYIELEKLERESSPVNYRIELGGANLRGVDLRNIDFTDVDLTGAALNAADFGYNKGLALDFYCKGRGKNSFYIRDSTLLNKLKKKCPDLYGNRIIE